MSKRRAKDSQPGEDVVDYRHKNITRTNIPPAGIAARGQIAKERQIRLAYNPHLSPTLRFDATGEADKVHRLIEKAGTQKLEPEEVAILEEALRNHEPWLEWAGKREQQWCVADPVALHLHERISTQAILHVIKRQDIQRSLFADPEQEYREAVQFYKHPMDWTNRMILGDSLSVMASLARREALAGKVQMIYMDPPYAIKYASNFQPEVGRRDVKDKDEDLTREPEMVKAYRDTWTLGVHSYLSYLRDRLLLCKELLADSGSIFVQMNAENLHLIRHVMTDVFRSENFIALVTLKKTAYQASATIANVTDYLVWFAKDASHAKIRSVYMPKASTESFGLYKYVEEPNGHRRLITYRESEEWISVPEHLRQFRLISLVSQGAASKAPPPIVYHGKEFRPPENCHWKTTVEGLSRAIGAERVVISGVALARTGFVDDFSISPINNIWTDTMTGSFTDPKVYSVQTNTKIIERCLLMTTDPGDLVLDPTCGSGTTAYVAEEWGRRWVTIDVSRVALAIARQRLLTAKYDYYRLRPTSAEDVQRNPEGPWLTDLTCQIQGSCTFDCKTVPHITLKSIAQNQALDTIFAKWEPVLAEKLKALNMSMNKHVTKDMRFKLLAKLEEKRKLEGKKAITDADERRWRLPKESWQEWEVPFDTDPEWPKPLQVALTEYRKAWRHKMDEVHACIAARADQEELVDQPFVEKGKVRVSGPFTMEGVIPAEESIDVEEPLETPIGGAPDQMKTFGDGEGPVQTEGQNAEAYLDRMLRLLREDGVRFPNNKVMKLTTLEMLADGLILHASGTWTNGEGERRVAVMFGPRYGPLVAPMVEDGIRSAARRGFDDLIFAAFGFDGAAQAAIQEDPDPKLRIHMAQIRPDVTMGDLLKTTVSSQLFTVSGSPRTSVQKMKDGQYVVTMDGVDIYDPVTNSVRSTGADKIAAWFLDSDYDGRCFCICQACFPDKSAWEKLGKALGGTLGENAFANLTGTTSLPFPVGQHKRIAVKVIDPRGNEVLRVHKLGGTYD